VTPGPSAVGEQRGPSGLRLTVTLAAAGLIAGLALVTAYQKTLPLIEANKAAALERAVTEVVPGAKQMHGFVVEGQGLRAATKADKGDRVYAGYDADGGFLGYAIVGAGPGFQDQIVLIYGYDPETKLTTGLKVLESRETPGLGDKIISDGKFLAQFGKLALDPPVVAVKNGAKTPNQLDAITGATISSRAVVSIINKSAATWRPVLPDRAHAPPLPAETTSPKGKP